jgi:hypothetical protein
MEEIKSIELKIHAKNQQRQVTKTQLQQQKRKRQGKYDENENAYDYASDEDDFYDRTKTNKSHPISPIRRKIPSISESKAGTSPRETNGTSGGNGENVLTASSIQKKISQLESELKRLETKQQQIQMAIDEK